MTQDNRNWESSGQREMLNQEALNQAVAAVLARNPVQNPEEEENGETSIDMVELFFHVLGKIHFVIIAAIVGTLLAFAYVHFLYEPTYAATAKLYIQNTTGISVSVGDMQVASNLTLDYQEVFKTWDVEEAVEAAMPEITKSWNDPDSPFPPYTPEEFELHDLSLSNPNSTRVLYITVKHPRGEVAIEIANAYAEEALNFILARMGNAYEPTEFSAAKYAETVGMGKTRYLLLGFIGGAGIVLAALVLLFLVDDRPRTPDDITKMAGIPTLAVVPREHNATQSRRRMASHRKEGK